MYRENTVPFDMALSLALSLTIIVAIMPLTERIVKDGEHKR